MKRKLIKYITALIISLPILTAIQIVDFASASTNTSTHTINQLLALNTSQPKILLAENKLIIPKPSYLTGADPSTQAKESESGGIRQWVVENVMPRLTVIIVGFVGTSALIMLIVSGVRYLTAYGNDEAATSAKKMIIYSIVGLLLAIFSYAIVSIIINLKIV